MMSVLLVRAMRAAALLTAVVVLAACGANESNRPMPRGEATVIPAPTTAVRGLPANLRGGCASGVVLARIVPAADSQAQAIPPSLLTPATLSTLSGRSGRIVSAYSVDATSPAAISVETGGAFHGAMSCDGSLGDLPSVLPQKRAAVKALAASGFPIASDRTIGPGEQWSLLKSDAFADSVDTVYFFVTAAGASTVEPAGTGHTTHTVVEAIAAVAADDHVLFMQVIAP